MSDHPHQKLITTVFAFTTEKGAITQLYAATAEEAGNYGGKVDFHRFSLSPYLTISLVLSSFGASGKTSRGVR